MADVWSNITTGPGLEGMAVGGLLTVLGYELFGGNGAPAPDASLTQQPGAPSIPGKTPSYVYIIGAIVVIALIFLAIKHLK